MFKKSNEKMSPDSGVAAEGAQKIEEEKALKENLDKIKHKLVVLSGKGGVGKSTVAVNIAVALANKGYRVGLFDVDIHGPSVPKMLGLEGERLSGDESGRLFPVESSNKMKVISIGFLMGNSDEAVIWRGPMKHGAIKQLMSEVTWGELDYLVIDSPPGTGDEPLAVCQLINPDGAIVVTTPQDVALADVKKSITFCGRLDLPVSGVIENMSGFVCPHCGKSVDIFKKGGGKRMSDEMGVPFLGSIPIEVEIMENGDSGNPFMGSDNASKSGSIKAFEDIVNNIIKKIGENS